MHYCMIRYLPPALYLILLSVSLASAEALNTGDYTVQVNAVTTSFLEETVLQKYGIEQDKDQALITVMIQRKQNGATSVPANVEVTATNKITPPQVSSPAPIRLPACRH